MTQKGLQDLKTLISLAFPDIAAPTKTDLEACTGVGRAIISDILRGSSKARNADTFARLFEKLNAAIKEEQQIEFDEELHCEDAQQTSKQSPPLRTPSEKRLTDPAISIRLEQQVVDSLWELDCVDQWSYFERHWPQCDRAAIISIRAKGIDTQKWLVKRFAKKIPRFATALPFPLEMRSYAMRSNPNALWENIADRLGVTAEPEVVIQKLCDCYQTQSVIIALYGLDCDKRFQDQQKQVMEELWEPLYQRLCNLPSRSRFSRLVLFLTGDITDALEPSNYSATAPPDPIYSLRLPELRTISQRDVEIWMGRQHVYETLSALGDGLDIDALLENDLPNWQDEPGEVLQEIQALCGNFDFRRHWELTG